MLIVTVVIAATVVGVVQASLVEWVFHKYWLHRPWAPKDAFVAHTMIHHQVCKFEDTFHVEEEEQEEALEFQWWLWPLLTVIALLPWWPLAHLLRVPFPIALTFAISFVGTFSAYYAGFVVLHLLMHKPRFPRFERSRFFRFVKRHHQIHHVRMNRNLNVVLPIGDFLLRTLVTDTEVPKKTPSSARALARRHSKFGKRLRRAGGGAQADPRDRRQS